MGSRPHPERRLVERFFLGTLGRRNWDPLFQHLGGCERCRAEFTRGRLALRSLGGKTLEQGPALTRIEADLIEQAVLEDSPPFRRRAFALGGLAAACAAAALLLLSPRAQDTRWDERGPAVAGAGFDVLCLPADESAPPVSARANDGRCEAGSYLKTTVAALEGRLGHSAVVALDDGFEVRFLARGANVGPSPSVLPGHLVLASGARLLFIAVFSGDPIDEKQLREAVGRARAQGLLRERSPRLDLAASAQLVLRLEATGKKGRTNVSE